MVLGAITSFENFKAFKLLVESGVALHNHPEILAFLVSKNKKDWIDYLIEREAILPNSYTTRG
jgi:hypothetical protein